MDGIAIFFLLCRLVGLICMIACLSKTYNALVNFNKADENGPKEPDKPNKQHKRNR